MLEKVRVAIIGAGGMANRVHYPSLASFDDVEVAAICDLDVDRLTTTADQYDIQGRYTDYRKMVEDVAPDAIYAIGQPQYMYDIWTWCLAQKLNLCVEKPLGITIHQARALAHLAEQNGCITQVSFQRRSNPLLAHLHAECRKRGPVIHAQCSFFKHEIRPYLHARDRMMDDGVHAIDTLRWLCGGEVVQVQSLTKRVHVPDINFISALLHFDNGATGILINSWSSGRRIFKVEVHAAGICGEGDPEGVGHLYADGDTTGVAYESRQVAGSDEFYIFGGFRAKNREFIDAVKSRTLPQSHFGDGLKTMEIAETILAQSLLAGR